MPEAVLETMRNANRMEAAKASGLTAMGKVDTIIETLV